MQHLADLLATIPLPEPAPASPDERAAEDAGDADLRTLLAGCSACDTQLVQELGADLPAGHLHVWGGPAGAGKTAFLLCLLEGAAAGGRRVVYATYDLPAETLALRLLAMMAGVPWRALPDPGAPMEACSLTGVDLLRARAARTVLSRLPFDILPARGLRAASLEDRLVRMPFRPDVLAVDYMQAVVGEPDAEAGTTLRALSEMAARLHVAVLCALRAGSADGAPEGATSEKAAASSAFDAIRSQEVAMPERLGWIAPVPGSASGEASARQAEVLHNRYGETPSISLHLDEATGRFGP